MSSGDDKKRTRFSAVVEEMTATISPMRRMPDPKTLKVPRVFEQEIVFVNGRPSSCPQCGTAAFTPVLGGDGSVVVLCRGCPLPAPSFPLVSADTSALNLQPYTCTRCSACTQVTMMLSRVNLHCEWCRSLTLHDMKATSPAPATRLRAREARITINNVSFGDGALVDVVLMSTPTVDDIYLALGLRRAEEWAADRRASNMANGLKPRDWDRRTGRTTRGILGLIARCARERVSTLFVLTGPAAMRECVRYAVDLNTRFRSEFPGVRHPTKIRGLPDNVITSEIPQDSLLYIDHHVSER